MSLQSSVTRFSLFVVSVAFVGAIGFLPAFAVSNGPENPKCVQAPNDPYDPAKMITFGLYKGKCVDSSDKRPARVISENDQEIVIANFLHMGRFWIAHIPKDSVDAVTFRIDPFGSGIPFITAAHTLIRFDLKAGKEITLQGQYAGEEALVDTDALKVNSFFFSVNYMAPKGVSYNLFPGMASEYPEAMNFLSAHDRGNAHEGSKYKEQDLLLTLPEGGGDLFLAQAIKKSAAEGMDAAYNTYSENCTTALFDIMDTSIPYGHAVKRFTMSRWRIIDPIAGPSIKALKERGLLAQNYGQKPGKNSDDKKPDAPTEDGPGDGTKLMQMPVQGQPVSQLDPQSQH